MKNPQCRLKQWADNMICIGKHPISFISEYSGEPLKAIWISEFGQLTFY